MSSNPLKLIIILVFLTISQPRACSTQFYPQRLNPFTGSISNAQSTAFGRQLELGKLGLSRNIVNTKAVTKTNGGFFNGGTTSVAKSKARTQEVNLGGLDIGSTLTSTKTRTNGEVSRALSHDLNIGKFDIGTSLSRDNLRNGFGLHRSQEGGLQLGLGLLNIDLNRNQQRMQTLTDAKAQAQGENAFATSNSKANTQSRQFGRLGVRKTQSQSNALSASRQGETFATAGGIASNAYNFGLRRRRRTLQRNYARPQSTFNRVKRKAQFIPFTESDFIYPTRQFSNLQRPNHGFGFPVKQNANAKDLTDKRSGDFQQPTEEKEFNNNDFYQNNAASTNVNRDQILGLDLEQKQQQGGLGVRAQAKSDAFADFHSHSPYRAYKTPKSKSFYQQPRRQQQNQTSSPTLKIFNNSTEINWPKNRIQLYNHYPTQEQQQQQQQQLQPHQRKQQQQQQNHYSSINPNSSTEQFAVIDENERHGRTFTFITDLINSFVQPTCTYPCTLEDYEKRRCCETALVVPQPPPNICCQQLVPPPPRPTIIRPPVTIVRPPPSITPPAPPTLIFPLLPTQCCNSCPTYGYYGPPPCTGYTLPGGGPGRAPLYLG